MFTLGTCPSIGNIVSMLFIHSTFFYDLSVTIFYSKVCLPFTHPMHGMSSPILHLLPGRIFLLVLECLFCLYCLFLSRYLFSRSSLASIFLLGSSNCTFYSSCRTFFASSELLLSHSFEPSFHISFFRLFFYRSLSYSKSPQSFWLILTMLKSAWFPFVLLLSKSFSLFITTLEVVPKVSRMFLSILVDLCRFMMGTMSFLPNISNFSVVFSRFSVIISSTRAMIGIAFTIIFHVFNSLSRSMCFWSLSLSLF